MSHGLTCREFVDFLDDYLADALSPPRRDEFNDHLSRCPSCVAYMKAYRATVEMGRAALKSTDAPLPGDVPGSLVRAVLAARRKG
jgi:anti-sigma factor RsiW